MSLTHYLILGALLFTISVVGIFLNRKNLIVILMAIELMLLAVNINFIAFSRYGGVNLDGQAAAIFVIILAAAEAAIALAIVLNIYHRFHTVNVDEVSNLKE